MDDLTVRLALAILLLLIAVPGAQAQQKACVDYITAWSVPYPAGQTVYSTTYFQTPPQLFGVQMRDGGYLLYTVVPKNVAQRFTNVTSADQLYKSIIANTYCRVLLAAKSFCPLLNENGGWLLADTGSRCIGPPPILDILVSDNGTPLIPPRGNSLGPQ